MTYQFVYFFIMWLIIQIINIFLVKYNKLKDLKLAQNIPGLINCLILIIYFFLIKKKDKKINIILFITYYLTDLLYYFVFFVTDIDLVEKNIDDNKKKQLLNERKLYILHHIISLTLLFSAYHNIDNDIIHRYTNIFIVLLEIPTIFLNLNYLLKYSDNFDIKNTSNILFYLSFIICRTLLYNIFLIIFIAKYHKKFTKNKTIKNLNLMIINLLIISFGNIYYGIKNVKKLHENTQ